MRKMIFAAMAVILAMPVANASEPVGVVFPGSVVSRDPSVAGGNQLTGGAMEWSSFANPASVSFAEDTFAAAVSYQMWAPSSAAATNNISVGASYRLGKIGITAGFMTASGKSYDIVNDQNIANGTFTPNDMQINVGAGYQVMKFLSVGANFKYLSSKLSPEYSMGTVAFDVMAMGKFSDFTGVLGVTSLGGKVDGTYSLPASFAAGVGYAADFGLKANVEMNYYFSGGFRAGIGAEYCLMDIVSVRAGYNLASNAPVPSYANVGLGVKFAGVKLDFSYLLAASDSPIKNTLAVALGYTF